MDSKKSLKDYISPALWLRIVTWALFAATVIALFTGIGLSSKDDTSDAAPFSKSSKSGSYVYIDVVLVSNWLYNVNNGEQVYYTVMDINSNWYTVKLSKAQFSAMSVQYNYFLAAAEGDPYPQPYRIYGMVQKPDADVVDAVAAGWKLNQIQYYQAFGNFYLNATSSPSSSAGSSLFVVAMFAFILWLIFFAQTFGPGRSAKKNLSFLGQTGELDYAANEFSDLSAEIIAKDKARLSNRFIFGKGSGAAIRYADIAWCYKYTLNNRGAVTSSLIVYTNTQKKKQAVFTLRGMDNEGWIQHAIEVISARNPAARVGYSAENIQASRNGFVN